MKIAFDVDVLAKQMDINRMVHQVADWGYKYIEQSPHPRINPFYKHPLFSKECEQEYRKALRETGVEISSFIVVYHWSGPTEEQRKMAVANWKRMIEIAVNMGVPVINTELSGDPNQQEICNGMWFRSMEELLPIIEREGLRVEIQSHPYDFCELNNETCDKVVIEAQAKQEKIPLKQSLKALVTNQYFWAVVILWTMQNGIYCVTGTILPYYCKYIFHNDTWMYSTLYLTETLIIVVATFLSPMLLKKYGKRNMSLAGACLALVGQLIFCLNPTNFGFMVFSCIIRGLGLAPLNSIVFGFLGDVVEFGQWKNHIRQESLIFAGSSVGMKVGAGLTSAIITGLLSISGYISSTSGAIEQPDSAIRMIINVYRFAPLVVWVSVIITLSLYKLDKMYPMIMKELTEREAKGVL